MALILYILRWEPGVFKCRIQIRNLAAEALANPRSEDLTNAVSWMGKSLESKSSTYTTKHDVKILV